MKDGWRSQSHPFMVYHYIMESGYSTTAQPETGFFATNHKNHRPPIIAKKRLSVYRAMRYCTVLG